MTERPAPDEIARWQRWFAVECNNRAWKLTAQAERTPAEDREMLGAAYAAAFHWSRVGTPINDARADLTLAHVHALLGHGEQAWHHAQRCLALVETGAGEDWDLAFAHAEMAHAASVRGDAAAHARHYATAERLGAAIADEEDRRVFLEEFARIPRSVPAPQEA